MEASTPVRAAPRFSRMGWAVGLFAVIVISAWLLNAPAGLLGKADAVGYAFCHRIEVRSFHLGTRPLPLCARCTGMYLGAALGLIVTVAAGGSRSGALPPTKILAALMAFIGIMGVDGVNSFATLIPGAPHLYEPRNWLRLFTGLGAGLAMALMVYPVFASTVWRSWGNVPGIGRPRQLGLLVGLALVAGGLVLTEEPVVLFPLAILSVLGLLALLTLIDSVMFMLVTGHVNRADGWRDAARPVTAGIAIAMAQVLVVDLLRYSLTGTWSGFVI